MVSVNSKVQQRHPSKAVVQSDFIFSIEDRGELSACVIPSVQGSLLKIVETTTGNLLQEHSFSQNISCISWAMFTKGEKKKKKTISGGVHGLIIGCENGIVMIYSIENGKVMFELKGHKDLVYDVKTSGRNAYSCSRDGSVIHWDLDAMKSLSCFVVDPNMPICKLAVGPEETIAAANHIVHLIDLKTQKIVKSFQGHDESVTDLFFDGTKLLSVSSGRIVRLWDISTEETKAINFKSNIAKLTKSDKTFACLLENGEIHVLSNGEKIFDVRFVAQGSKKKRSDTFPCLFALNVDSTLLVAWGLYLEPRFEWISWKQGEHQILERNLTRNILLNNEKQNEKISEPVAILGPMDMQVPFEPSMEEKLASLSVETSTADDDKTPKLGSMNQMLTQAIHTQDSQLFEQVLNVGDMKLIESTVRKMPTSLVLPFLLLVVEKFQNKHTRGSSLLHWIKAIFYTHAAFLMTIPELPKKLTGLYAVVDSRLSMFGDLLQLSGRLDMIAKQINRKSRKTEKELVPMITYESDLSEDGSSEEEEVMALEEEEEGLSEEEVLNVYDDVESISEEEN